jgi:hypothetical protein
MVVCREKSKNDKQWRLMMIVLCGRNIKVATGQKSQTINICTVENTHGQYEYKIRLHPPFIDQNELLKLQVNTIEEIADYIVSV